jgi:DNA primase
MKDKNTIKQRLSLECVLRYYRYILDYPEGFLHCPFHMENTPSFHYDLVKNLFFCHGQGCGVSGDIFNFIQLKEGCSFFEAISIAERILDEYETKGFSSSIEDRKPKERSPKQANKSINKASSIIKHQQRSDADRFSFVLNEILKVFPLPEGIKQLYLCGTRSFFIEGHVYNSEWGVMQKKKEIYHSPNFFEETISAYGIGYCGLSCKNQIKALREKGITDSELLESGFFTASENGTLRLAETMKARILYPFLRNGKVVQIAGRKVAGFRTENKFTKTKGCTGMGHIFNYDILEKSQCILITEGVADCIRANEVGIASVSPVTNHFEKITFQELSKLLRGKRVGICFDNDQNDSGQKGAWRTQQMLREHGIEAGIILLPREEDKDKIDVCEFINTYGSKAFKELLRQQGFDVLDV